MSSWAASSDERVVSSNSGGLCAVRSVASARCQRRASCIAAPARCRHIHEPCVSHRYVRYCTMTGSEFEKRIRKLGRRRGVPVSFDRRHGKGSHGRLYYGDRFTTLKDRKQEIGPGLLKAMLNRLGLTKENLEE